MEILKLMLTTGDTINVNEVIEIGKEKVDIVDDKGKKLLIAKEHIVYMVHS